MCRSLIVGGMLIVAAALGGCAERKDSAPAADAGKKTASREDQPARAEAGGGAPAEFSHVIVSEAEYYTTGPQQGRPPDGKFAAGTKVSVVKDSGSYTLVRSESGVQAYVAASSLKHAADAADVHVDVSSAVDGINQFACDIYGRLRTGEGNLFLSPGSISVALAMTYAGAAGITQTEMAKTLHFGAPREQLHVQMRALHELWKSGEKKQGFRLAMANRLWGQNGFKFLPEFLALTRDEYGAELAELDFQKDPEKARQAINTWVEDRTEKKIENLIPSADVVRNARLVVTNAVYFKGDWTEPFNKDRTKEDDFHVSAAQAVKARLMNRQHGYRYAASDGMQALELPYGDRTLSMVVLLPDSADGLAALEEKLSADNLRKWMDLLRKQEVVVFLPRFKTTSQFQLSDALIALGMPSAFDAQTADFSRMTGNKDLFISAVLHKAFVDVNEEGTEAAAATGVIIAPTAAPIAEPKEPPVFRADHPFVFLIRDNRSGAILFLGRIIDPTR